MSSPLTATSLFHKGSELGPCAECEGLRGRLTPDRPLTHRFSLAGILKIGERESRIGFMKQAPTRQETTTVTGPLVAAIEAAWSSIQDKHAEVPHVVLTLGNGTAKAGQLTFGHFHDAKWAAGDGRLPELFIGGEGLRRGARALLGTLLHEAAHGVASIRGIRNTSRQGRYHNTKFP